jgi:hypothetical protein
MEAIVSRGSYNLLALVHVYSCYLCIFIVLVIIIISTIINKFVLHDVCDLCPYRVLHCPLSQAHFIYMKSLSANNGLSLHWELFYDKRPRLGLDLERNNYWLPVLSQYDDRVIEDRSPAEARDFSSSLCVQTGSEAHPVSCTMGTGGPYHGPKARPGRDADHSPHLLPSSWMSRSYTYSPSPAPPQVWCALAFTIPVFERCRFAPNHRVATNVSKTSGSTTTTHHLKTEQAIIWNVVWIKYIRSEFLTVVKMSMLVFWVVPRCGLAGTYRRFRRTYCLHLPYKRGSSRVPPKQR